MGMMIFRPGQRLVIPGVRVFQPRVTSAAATWWDNNGAISGCVAAYAPKGAADLASSYINLANPGTYNASPGVAPTFSSADGWSFNGSTQYLTTGVVPAHNQTWSLIVRFSNGGSLGVTKALAGCREATGTADFLIYYSTGAGKTFRNGGTLSVAGNVATGILAFAGNKGYHDGNAQTGVITTGSGSFTNAIVIGALNNAGSIIQFGQVEIQALAIYSTILTAGEVATITTAMQAL